MILAAALSRFAEDTIELGLGAGIARRCQPSALQLAIVPAFQPLAELFGAVPAGGGVRYRLPAALRPRSMYFFPSMSWAAYGSDTATCLIDA